MALWTLSNMRDEIRKLSGRLSTSNPTNDQLDERIDRYIRYKLPAEVKFHLTERFYSFSTTSGTSKYTFPSDFQTLIDPAYVGDERMNVFFDADLFWNRWLVDSSETNAKPQDILIYDNDLVLRPTPDDTYTIRILGNKRLDNFASSGSITATNTLEAIDGQEGWGEVIVYGVAIDLLVSGGEYDKAKALKQFYDRVRALAQDATAQMLTSQRSIPSF